MCVSRPNGTWRRFYIEMNVFGVNGLEMIGYEIEWLMIAGYHFTSKERRRYWWIVLDQWLKPQFNEQTWHIPSSSASVLYRTTPAHRSLPNWAIMPPLSPFRMTVLLPWVPSSGYAYCKLHLLMNMNHKLIIHPFSTWCHAKDVLNNFVLGDMHSHVCNLTRTVVQK